jgi:hypothetical protein
VLVQKQVSQLQVSMNDAFGVEVSKCLKKLEEIVLNLPLCEAFSAPDKVGHGLRGREGMGGGMSDVDRGKTG